MSTIAEIRLANLELLIQEFGTQDEVAALASTSPVYLSQVRNRAMDSKTGRAREMGGIVARKLEAGCKKDKGWMDVAHVLTAQPEAKTPTAATTRITPTVNQTPKIYAVETQERWPFVLFTYSDWMRLPTKDREAFENEIAGALLRNRQTLAVT